MSSWAAATSVAGMVRTSGRRSPASTSRWISSNARWGSAGRGRWITIYANGGHVFMEVAGLRFDTGGIRGSGTRWQATGRSTAGFVARHPEGL